MTGRRGTDMLRRRQGADMRRRGAVSDLGEAYAARPVVLCAPPCAVAGTVDLCCPTEGAPQPSGTAVLRSGNGVVCISMGTVDHPGPWTASE